MEISVSHSSGVFTATMPPWWYCGLPPWLYSELLYSCVILAEFQAETEGYARPYGWHRNECFNMLLTSAGSPFLLQSLDKGAPPTPLLPLLFPPKALTASSSNQIPVTVQWSGPISDNAVAACLSGCMYVRTLVRETIQSCIKFFSLYLSCYLW